jgi:hypothetical protein
MAMKPKLTALKKLVGKLAANAPRSGVGAGWLTEWKLNDLTMLVKEAIAPAGGYAAALLFVAQKEALRLGRSNDPQVRAALDSLNEAIGRRLNPPPGADRKELDDAVGEAIGPATDWILPAWGVNRNAPDAWTPPPNGRPPRLTDLPPEWFPTDTPPVADGENPDDKAA